MKKHEYSSEPASMAAIEKYGFSWIDFVTAIPSPLFVVTTYKANGLSNACLQSWSTFAGDEDNCYCIMSSVNKQGHLYQTIQDTGVMVLNFPSADIYPACLATIRNNRYDQDEIAASGLTAEPAVTVQAPRIKECFLNLEATYCWEQPLGKRQTHVVLCAAIKHICMAESHLDESRNGRYGDSGYLYNIHNPINPVTGKAEGDWLGVLKKKQQPDY